MFELQSLKNCCIYERKLEIQHIFDVCYKMISQKYLFLISVLLSHHHQVLTVHHGHQEQVLTQALPNRDQSDNSYHNLYFDAFFKYVGVNALVGVGGGGGLHT